MLGEPRAPGPPPLMTRRDRSSNKPFWWASSTSGRIYPRRLIRDLSVYSASRGRAATIGVLSLLGLAWTLKFLWAPAIDYWRHHRRWMAAVDVAMGCAMLYFATLAGFGPMVWLAIGVFTALSATNDIAIDGYTIEYLGQDELGLANGIRIGLYRVGMLASGFVLMASEWLGCLARRAFGRGVFAMAVACSSAARGPAHDAAGSARASSRRSRFAAGLRRRGLCWGCCGSSWHDHVVYESIAAFWITVVGVALAVVLVR